MAQTFRKWHKIYQICENGGERKIFPSANPEHDYLRSQQAYSNQILSEASLGWGKGCIRFLARSDFNSGFHGNG